MNVVLLIPDGVGVRNFVLGPFLRTTTHKHHLHALHTIPDEMLPLYQQAELNGHVSWHAAAPYREWPIPYTLRTSLSYSQMYWVDNFPLRMVRNWPVRGSWKTRSAARVAKALGYAAAFPRGIQMLEQLHSYAVSRLPEVEMYRERLRSMNPAVLLCSHQRPPTILAPVAAARSLGIPTATFIFSWDNLSSKGRIATPFDHYLVWSEHMRNDLMRYYPHVAPHQIHVVGTPQFDPYADRSALQTREAFFQSIGADPARPLVCYSGGDAGNAKEDAKHIRALMELIRDGRIPQRPQILLRPAPVDDGTRYETVRRDFPELIYAQPAWRHTCQGEWSAVFPLREDVNFLANVTYHADMNVNFASTMTLDFAIRNKPVVNLAFDVSDPPLFDMPMWEYYQKWDHYRPVIELGAARFARTRDELAEHITAYLDQPELDAEGRRRFVELEVGAPIGTSSRRIMETLEQIAR